MVAAAGSGDLPACWFLRIQRACGENPSTRQNPLVTLRDVIGRLDEFADDQTIYAESAAPTAEAIVADEAEGAVPLPYLLEVTLAREAVEVWGGVASRTDAVAGRQGRSGPLLHAERRLAAGGLGTVRDARNRRRNR
jgi:hypothetical protein